MSKRIVTIVASLVAALVGGWLILAPFALGYRPAGAAWNHPTEVDFWTGVGVVVLALVALAASLGGVRAELRARGALAPKPTRAERQERKAEAAAAAAEAKAQAGAAQAGAVQAGAPQAGAGAQQALPGQQGLPGQPGAPTAPELRDLLAPLVLALLNDLTPGTASGDHGNASGDHGNASGDHGNASGDHGTVSGDHGSASGDHGTVSGDPNNPQSNPDNGNHLSGPSSRPAPRSYS